MIQRLILSLLAIVGFVACTKSTSSNEIQSFEQFSIIQPIPITAACDEKCVSLKKEFRYVVYVGEQIYCYWAEKQKETGFDYKQIAANIESRITSLTSVQDYYMLLMEWAASFHDGHVNVMTGAVPQENFEFYNPSVRFELLAAGTADEKLIISKLGTDVTTLRTGTEVLTIDGKPWQDSFQEAIRLTSGSTERMRRKYAARSVLPILLGMKDGFKDLHIAGTFKGQPIEENVSRVLNLSDGATDPFTPETGINYLQAKIIEGNIGYLRIDGFAGSKMATLLDQAMSRLKNTKGLLIDVRANGGGTPVGNNVLSYLIDQQIVRYSMKVRNTDMLMMLAPDLATALDFISPDWSENWTFKVQPNPQGKYKNPVVVLTSANCFSACDTFVSALKEHNLAKVVGEPTAGGTGSPRVVGLPISRLMFRYSVQKGFKALSGGLIEGVGTDVDYAIFPTVEERAAGKDEQLKKALVYLQGLMGNPPPAKIEVPAVAQNTQPLRSPLVELDAQIQQSGLE